MDFHFDIDATSKPAYGGDYLSGTVLIRLKDAGRKVSARELSVYFKGTLDTTVTYDKQNSKKFNHYAYSKDQFLRLNLDHGYTILDMEGHVKPGDHIIPFRFDIPKGLPPSFHIVKGMSNAKAVYCVGAALLGSGFLTNYEGIRVVHVKSDPKPLKLVPFCSKTSHESIFGSWFKCKGDIFFGVKVLDTHLVPGQRPQVRLAVVNESVAPLRQIKVTIRAKAVWWAKSSSSSVHRKKKKTDLFVSKIPLDTFPTPHVDDLQRKALKSVDMDARKQKHAETISKQLQDGNSDKTNLPLFVLPPIPDDVVISMHSPNLTVTHTMFVQIKTHTDYSDMDEIEIPITIAADGPPNCGGGNGTPVLTQLEPAEGHLPMAHAVLIAEATNVVADDEDEHEEENAPCTDERKEFPMVQPSAPEESLERNPYRDFGAPSLEQLIILMSHSLDDYHLVASRIGRDDWKPVFSSMTPTDYGRVLEQVHLEVHQLPVATALAQAMGALSCNHVRHALPHMSSYSRPILVEQVLPLCHDAAARHESLLLELSEEDQYMLGRVLRRLLPRLQGA